MDPGLFPLARFACERRRDDDEGGQLLGRSAYVAVHEG